MADIRSEGERDSGNYSSPNFEQRMEEPQKAILAKDWGSFRRFFENDRNAILEPLDLSGNTALHVAAIRWNKPELIRELLDLLPDEAHRWRALRKGNAHNNTVLHQVIYCKNVMMVDAVLNYGEQLQVPQDEEGEDKNLPLLELVNDNGETPVYRVAKYGKLKMLKHMARKVDVRNHLYRRQRREDALPDRTSILHIAIMGQHFEVAQWLISNVEGVDEVASANDGNELSCLQLLSGMPSVFRSCYSDMGFIEKLIYGCVPLKCYGDGTYESGILNAMKTILFLAFVAAAIGSVKRDTFPIIPGISVALAILSVIQIPKAWDRLEKIWKTEKQHMLAEKLADFLVKRDNSWMYSKRANPRKEVVLSVIQLSNVAVRRKARQADEEGESENLISSKVYTPLLLAASTGIVEIVKKIIDLHPDALSHISHDEHNILHVTVKHRQKEIYKLLKKYGALESLAAEISNKGCTLLHHAAMMDQYDGGNQAGVVFQLQEELRWFDRVQKITPSAFVLYRNDDKLTAWELFELEHSGMLNEAQAWIKGTAQSCSIVAILIATAVFQAAYTVPGGYDANGVPVLLHKAVFKFFIITDSVALVSSQFLVIIFLKILVTPFQMQEFNQRLPLELSRGFAWLSISSTAKMLTFVSAILSNFGMHPVQVFLIIIFSIMAIAFSFQLNQYYISMIVKHNMKKLWKDIKEVVPKWLIKLLKPTKERAYSKYS